MNISQPDRSRRKASIQNLALVLSSLLLSLVFSETILRLTWTPWVLRSTPAKGPHPIYGGAPIPGIRGTHISPEFQYTFRHNRQSMRGDKDFSTERPPDIDRRVLFLGDSFTYGIGSNNEETFVERLARGWPRTEVANTGCNGYGTQDELAVLDHLGPVFKPDLVVLVFFWNDLSDNLRRPTPSFAIDPAGKVVRTRPEGVADNPLDLKPAIQPPSLNPWRHFFLEELISEGLKTFRYKYLGRQLPYAHTEQEIRQGWVVTKELLEMAALRAREMDAKVVIVSLPDHNQVNPRARIKNILPLHFEVQEYLKAVCREAGLPLIDLLPALRDSYLQTGTDYYFYADRHLTPKGNERVAEILKPLLDHYWK